MQKKGRLANLVIILTIILIQTLLYVFVASKKEYIHMDEAYSYGLTNYDRVNIYDNEEAKRIKYNYEFEQNLDMHPNSVDFILDGKIQMIVSGNSVGAGNVEIVKIDDFATKISGEYNTLVLFYKDKPGMISKVSTLIQKENINIASLDCDRNARGKTASMCICLDGNVSDILIDEIKKIDDVYFVRNVKKLEA